MWFNKINHSQFIFVGVETIPKWVVYCFNHMIGIIIITIPLFHNHILIIIPVLPVLPWMVYGIAFNHITALIIFFISLLSLLSLLLLLLSYIYIYCIICIDTNPIDGY